MLNAESINDADEYNPVEFFSTLIHISYLLFVGFCRKKKLYLFLI